MAFSHSTCLMAAMQVTSDGVSEGCEENGQSCLARKMEEKAPYWHIAPLGGKKIHILSFYTPNYSNKLKCNNCVSCTNCTVVFVIANNC